MTSKVYTIDSAGTYFHGLKGTFIKIDKKAKRGPLIHLEVFHKGMNKKVTVAFPISKVREHVGA